MITATDPEYHELLRIKALILYGQKEVKKTGFQD